jgi:4-methyl-5(b-hydroxyethyl)-thiazole monophosphate biosynthesis
MQESSVKGGFKMTKRVSVFLADGFEEIEGLTVVDLLRRAGVEVTTVSITEKLTIHGAHKIDVQADKLFEAVNYDNQDMLVLPGGMPGTLHLGAHKGLENLLRESYENQTYLAA